MLTSAKLCEIYMIQTLTLCHDSYPILTARKTLEI